MFGWFRRRRPFISDGEIDLRLRGENLADDEKGITDGFVFDIYPRGSVFSVGYVDLRLGESRYLYYLGHIGYAIRPEWRGRGYAGKAVKLVSQKARMMGLQSLVITTNDDNWPSRRTCEKLGCVLERVVPVPADLYDALGQVIKCRYVLWTDEEEQP